MTPFRAIPVRAMPMLAAMAGVLLAAPAAHADTAVYLSNALTIDRGTMAGFDERGLIVLNETGRRQRVPLTELASVHIAESAEDTLPEMPEWAEPTRVYVDLIDGQRLIVDVDEPDDSGVLTGRATGFGPARIPLERILRIARPGASTEPTPSDTDTVLLANGDRLTGFVASLGPIVEIESDSGAIARVAIERVTGLVLANPPEPAPGVFVSDSTGTVLRAHTFEVAADGSFRLTTDAAALGVESQGEDNAIYQRRGVRFVSAERLQPDTRIVPLAGLADAETAPTGGRRWTRPAESAASVAPPARIDDILVPAPGSVRYEIPRNADRFACEIAHTGGAWTDCTVTVFAEQRDGSRVPLGGAALSAETHAIGEAAGWIAADLPDGTVAIVLEIEPGRFGAIQDAVLFRKPRLRVR